MFEEFQEIAGYKQAGFEKRLRTIIQQTDTISYIFCGSKRHLLNDIFTNQNRAFYKLAQSYPLAKIETSDYISWAQHLFKKAGWKVNTNIIEEIISRCDNHPMYVQQFFLPVGAAP